MPYAAMLCPCTVVHARKDRINILHASALTPSTAQYSFSCADGSRENVMSSLRCSLCSNRSEQCAAR
jgi:hypothetical protein